MPNKSEQPKPRKLKKGETFVPFTRTNYNLAPGQSAQLQNFITGIIRPSILDANFGQLPPEDPIANELEKLDNDLLALLGDHIDLLANDISDNDRIQLNVERFYQISKKLSTIPIQSRHIPPHQKQLLGNIEQKYKDLFPLYDSLYGHENVSYIFSSRKDLDTLFEIREKFLKILHPAEGLIAEAYQSLGTDYFLNEICSTALNTLTWTEFHNCIQGDKFEDFALFINFIRHKFADMEKFRALPDRIGTPFQVYMDLLRSIQMSGASTNETERNTIYKVIERFIELARGGIFSLWNESHFLKNHEKVKDFAPKMREFILSFYQLLNISGAIAKIDESDVTTFTSLQLVTHIRTCTDIQAFQAILCRICSLWASNLDSSASGNIEARLKDIDWSALLADFNRHQATTAVTESTTTIEPAKATNTAAETISQETSTKEINETPSAPKSKKPKPFVVPNKKKSRKNTLTVLATPDDAEIPVSTNEHMSPDISQIETPLDSDTTSPKTFATSEESTSLIDQVSSPEEEDFSSTTQSSPDLETKIIESPSRAYSELPPITASPLSFFKNANAQPFVPQNYDTTLNAIKARKSVLLREITDCVSQNPDIRENRLLPYFMLFINEKLIRINKRLSSTTPMNIIDLQDFIVLWNREIYEIYNELSNLHRTYGFRIGNLEDLLQCSYFSDVNRLQAPIDTAQQLRSCIQEAIPEIQAFIYGKDVLLHAEGDVRDIDILLCSPPGRPYAEQITLIEEKLLANPRIRIEKSLELTTTSSDGTFTPFHQWQIFFDNIPVDLTLRPDLNPSQESDLLRFAEGLKLSLAAGLLPVPYGSDRFSGVLLPKNTYQSFKHSELALLSGAPKEFNGMKPGDICYYLRTAISTRATNFSDELIIFFGEFRSALEQQNPRAIHAMSKFFMEHFEKRPYESHLFLLEHDFLTVLFPEAVTNPPSINEDFFATSPSYEAYLHTLEQAYSQRSGFPGHRLIDHINYLKEANSPPAQKNCSSPGAL